MTWEILLDTKKKLERNSIFVGKLKVGKEDSGEVKFKKYKYTSNHKNSIYYRHILQRLGG